ncbi:hypothetical protein CCR75_008633 [Bremia lactucae]|uniref:Uncharacterized protein n=1 Tax=Bremia lactucae TaxID=4779 RepID=A0A976FJ15_BRELC|nr:hypothetical protein CCR75_008633 [Bremia lactucae]
MRGNSIPARGKYPAANLGLQRGFGYSSQLSSTKIFVVASNMDGQQLNVPDYLFSAVSLQLVKCAEASAAACFSLLKATLLGFCPHRALTRQGAKDIGRHSGRREIPLVYGHGLFGPQPKRHKRHAELLAFLVDSATPMASVDRNVLYGLDLSAVLSQGS